MNTFWKVIITLIIIIIVVYGAYRVYHHYTWKPPVTQPVPTQTQSMKPKPSVTEVTNTVYKMAPVNKLGTIVTDPKGMTLYTYANDTNGTSTCTGACLTNWPAYVAQSQTGTFPANVSVIKRSDGTLQYAWKGMPLYYFVKDKKAGDANGNGVGGVWSVIK